MRFSLTGSVLRRCGQPFHGTSMGAPGSWALWRLRAVAAEPTA
jgi:hypothetical protein